MWFTAEFAGSSFLSEMVNGQKVMVSAADDSYFFLRSVLQDVYDVC